MTGRGAGDDFHFGMGMASDDSGDVEEMTLDSRVDVVTLELLPLPAATLRTIRGPSVCEPPNPEPIPTTLPFILTFGFSSVFTNTPTPTSLTSDPTLPFRSSVFDSGFNVSSEPFGLFLRG